MQFIYAVMFIFIKIWKVVKFSNLMFAVGDSMENSCVDYVISFFSFCVNSDRDFLCSLFVGFSLKIWGDTKFWKSNDSRMLYNYFAFIMVY